MEIGFIYMWENTLNSKKYIGSHKGDILDNYIGSGVYFKKAYNKYKKYFGLKQSTMSYLIKQDICIKGKCKGKIFNYA